jgi:hypothetical protein
MALSLAIGLSVALSSASCGTCPAGQQSCGKSNAGPSDASASGFDSASCGVLSALKKCMTSFCATTSNPFCTCYKRGFDLTTNGCVCIDFDAPKFCDEHGNDDGSSYDCGAASSGVSSYCVPVN